MKWLISKIVSKHRIAAALLYRHGTSLAMLAVLAVAASAPATAQQQLLKDPHFQRGVSVAHPDITKARAQGGIQIQGPLQYETANGNPVWELRQWWSQESIYGTTPEELPSGAYKWENAYKSIVIGPANSPQADLTLMVNSIKEYGGVYRKPSGHWPHIIVGQKVVDASPPISEMAAVNFSIDARLNRAKNLHDESKGYDPSRHAAHYMVYITVENRNPSSPGFGDFLYFGIELYDDREPLPELEITHGDRGNGKLIYLLGLDTFSNQGMQVGQWKNISGDLLPHIKDAMEYAWDNGFLQGSQDYADYKLDKFTLNWEVPGLSVVSIQTRDASLEAVSSE